MTRIVKPVPGLGPIFEGWVSPGVRAGDFVFTAGVIGADPVTGKVVEGVEAQIRRIFEELDLILTAHGSGLAHVVRLTMYFTDRPTQWPVLDRIRRELFPVDPPATTGVGVTAIEQGAAVEIEAIAIVPKDAAPATEAGR
ncbi:RidA family protein [Methylopila musalis]|uniref:RidA family protein n=1 Tax=Methylopila musalis TaxID=1134781 RepID=A0ABW3Z6A8_9HYPH